jgi:hypothetical protein
MGLFKYMLVKYSYLYDGIHIVKRVSIYIGGDFFYPFETRYGKGELV